MTTTNEPPLDVAAIRERSELYALAASGSVLEECAADVAVLLKAVADARADLTESSDVIARALAALNAPLDPAKVLHTHAGRALWKAKCADAAARILAQVAADAPPAEAKVEVQDPPYEFEDDLDRQSSDGHARVANPDHTERGTHATLTKGATDHE
jgi:hypothetical protein